MHEKIRRGLQDAGALLQAGQRARAADTYLEVAAAYAHAGRPLEALAVGFSALQLDPTRFVALAVGSWITDLGEPALPLVRKGVQIHLDANRWVDAAGLLELVVAILPRCAESRIGLAELHARCGRRESAMQIGRAALELFEADGNNRAIIAVAQHMLSIDARDRQALRALVRAQLRVGEADRAEQTVTLLLTLDPADPVALEALARRMIAAGDAEAALSTLHTLTASLGPAEAAAVLARAQRWCADATYRAGVRTLRAQTDRHEVVDAEIVELDPDDLMLISA